MARFLVASVIMHMDGVVGMCGFATCKDSEVCCCNATSGQSGFCVDAGSDLSVCTGSTRCPDGDSCCGKELTRKPRWGDTDDDICPGVGKKCELIGADGLGCCGAEHGPGFAFCQSNPDYICCSGSSYAISCPNEASCEISDAGIPSCTGTLQLEELVTKADDLIADTDDDICPGVGQKCEVLGADGLGCCGAEFGPGFAFCQSDPQYLCCSGATYAISCSSKTGCSVTDAGIPICQKALEVEETWHRPGRFGDTDEDICPGVGKKCELIGADGLGCCGAEHGPGFAFCQSNPDYICCSGSSYAISCPNEASCEISDAGIPSCTGTLQLEAASTPEALGDFVCHGVNYNITCGPQFTACCGEGTIAPLCMDASGHSCCKDEELNLAVTCEKGQKCNKGPQCTYGSVMV